MSSRCNRSFSDSKRTIYAGYGDDSRYFEPRDCVREMGMKDGQLPASKESIDAMLRVEIGEGEDGECAICLEEWDIGGVAKEMPCKHKFHRSCIEKWLGIHGSCPVCRYQMPVDEREVGREMKKMEKTGIVY